MAEHWYSSDWHWGHENILKFMVKCPECKGTGVFDMIGPDEIPCMVCRGEGKVPMRDFPSLKEMHEQLLSSHNAVVRPQDRYNNLGDVTMDRSSTTKGWLKGVVAQFNGHKRLFLGNHDHLPVEDYREVGFEKIRATNRVENLIISHYPLHPGSIPKGCVNVHGHIHSNPAPAGPYINVSVEVIGYRPVSLGELKDRARQILTRLREEEKTEAEKIWEWARGLNPKKEEKNA